jgi:hypothetical protein
MVGLPGEESNMTPPTVCIIALTVWQVALVMLTFTTTGFTPLLDPEATLLLVRVDPLQNLVHLVAGIYLARAARAGVAFLPGVLLSVPVVEAAPGLLA